MPFSPTSPWRRGGWRSSPEAALRRQPHGRWVLSWRVLAGRALAAAGLLLLVLSATFVLLELAPGDPARLVVSPRVPPEQREVLRRVYGLDRPLAERYVHWLGAAASGDWGVSFAQARPVRDLVAEALPPTLLLAAAAAAVEVPLGLLLGIVAARRAGRFADHAIRATTLALYAVPAFWLGLVAILLFHGAWRLFPASHMRSPIPATGLDALVDLLHHLALPALVLGVVGAGELARFVRAGLLEILAREHVRAARARGLGERRIVWVHALRNALPPVVQVLGLGLPALLSGALVVEVVFAWPGLGRLAYNAIQARDYPVVLATTALAGGLVVAGTLAADLLHAALDPRLRRD